MDIQWAIFLKVNSMKREQDQDTLSFNEGPSVYPLRKGRSSTAQIWKSRERKTDLHLHPLKSIKNWRVN